MVEKINVSLNGKSKSLSCQELSSINIQPFNPNQKPFEPKLPRQPQYNQQQSDLHSLIEQDHENNNGVVNEFFSEPVWEACQQPKIDNELEFSQQSDFELKSTTNENLNNNNNAVITIL